MRPGRSSIFLPLALLGSRQHALAQNSTKPNIVVIFTDDQDLHCHSLDYMPVLQKELVAKGTQFSQHYATVAQCCPSRASLFRGQAAHNTNITNVHAPGGNYQKWLTGGEGEDHLPVWLTKAGYNAEYLGKFLNGYARGNYMHNPPGWTHADILVDPWVYSQNHVVMSANGDTPINYPGFHQLDVIRTKALARIDKLADEQKPFYIQIAPSAPHVEGDNLPTPPERYRGRHKGLKAPRNGNWNPPDDLQKNKPSWVKDLASMNQSVIDRVDLHQRLRLDTLLGVDDIVHDVVRKLEERNIIDNTYIIYTTDNGFHLGAHRVAGGKTLPYREDTNLPFIVRGPRVPAGGSSPLPSTHIDLAPTFLELAGVDPADFPPMFDGRSLVGQWETQDPGSAPAQCRADGGDTPEILNVEFWGAGNIENSLQANPPGSSHNNTYKTLRIVGEDHSYLYSKWCSGEVELYDTAADPWELHNLAGAADESEDTKRLRSRLNALLLATKTCADQTCRNPWRVLQPGKLGQVAAAGSELEISCLDQALQPKYDDHFGSVPQVAFQECKLIQLVEFEHPFLPGPDGQPGAAPRLGLDYRKPTDNYQDPGTPHKPADVPGGEKPEGTEAQRNVTLDAILAKSTPLTKAQLGQE